MFRISNELITILAEEIAWKRNYLLKKLHDMEKIIDELEANDELTKDKVIKEDLKEVKQKIQNCLETLEDIDEDHHT